MNSVPNNFHQLKVFLRQSLTSIDHTFPKTQFLVNGVSASYILYRNRNDGRIMICIRGNIWSKISLKHVLPSHIEGFFTELEFREAR